MLAVQQREFIWYSGTYPGIVAYGLKQSAEDA